MRLFVICIVVVTLVGCSPRYVQLFKTKANNSISTDSTYKYESDTLLINYSFWYNKGIMAFSIYNKLSIPLYIDWKRSSFVSNIYKFNYWSDEVVTKGKSFTSSAGSSYGGIFRYNGPLIIPYLTLNNTSTVSSSTFESKAVKPERITFIPPKSVIYKSTYFLTERDYTEKIGAMQSIEKRADNPKRKKTTIYTRNFSEANSPLVFRNFMTISSSEDFKNESYIDNGFFVHEIKIIDKRHFEVWQLDSKGKTIYVNKYKKGVDFYRMPNPLSLSS